MVGNPLNFKAMRFYIVFIAILLFMTSCNYGSKQDKQTDSFYAKSSGFDYRRLPLIKPYEAISTNKETWDVQFHVKGKKYPETYVTGVINVKKVAVQNGVLMLFTPDSNFITEGLPIYQWFVVIPEKQVEKGFETEQEFLDYLKGIGMEKPEMKDIDTLHDQFEKTKCLDWIPDCK